MVKKKHVKKAGRKSAKRIEKQDYSFQLNQSDVKLGFAAAILLIVGLTSVYSLDYRLHAVTGQNIASAQPYHNGDVKSLQPFTCAAGQVTCCSYQIFRNGWIPEQSLYSCQTVAKSHNVVQ